MYDVSRTRTQAARDFNGGVQTKRIKSVGGPVPWRGGGSLVRDHHHPPILMLYPNTKETQLKASPCLLGITAREQNERINGRPPHVPRYHLQHYAATYKGGASPRESSASNFKLA